MVLFPFDENFKYIVHSFVSSSSAMVLMIPSLTIPASIHQDGYVTNVQHLTFIVAGKVKSSVLYYHSHYCWQCYTLEHILISDSTNKIQVLMHCI